MDEQQTQQQETGTETLVTFGSAVKALPGGVVEGYLIVFSGPNDPDISEKRDFFTSSTDYDLENGSGKVSQYYAHGMDEVLSRRRFGKSSLKQTEVGIWIQKQMDLADEYERAIYEMAKKGKLGWSSGVVGHLIERKQVGDAHEVISWPIAEASWTPTPAEPRTRFASLKSLAPVLTGELSFKSLLSGNESLTPTPAEPQRGSAALKSLEVPALLQQESGERVSLAERTERWLDTGTNLLAGYQQVKEAEVKVGRALSAARRGRLEQARQLIDDLLAETTARDEPTVAAQTEAAGTAAVDDDDATSVPFTLPVTDILSEVGWLETQRL